MNKCTFIEDTTFSLVILQILLQNLDPRKELFDYVKNLFWRSEKRNVKGRMYTNILPFKEVKKSKEEASRL